MFRAAVLLIAANTQLYVPQTESKSSDLIQTLLSVERVGFPSIFSYCILFLIRWSGCVLYALTHLPKETGPQWFP